jgi:hypothetical protein
MVPPSKDMFAPSSSPRLFTGFDDIIVSMAAPRNLLLPMGLSFSEEHPMADNKNPNEKQPGEKPEGKYHYNPGNQSGKKADDALEEETKKNEPRDAP